MQETFDRWKPWYLSSSWAFRLFIAHHTELNDLYWAHEPASRFTIKTIRNSTATITSEALGFLGVDADRLAPDLQSWSESYGKFGNWTRVNALLAVCSYFEVYLRTIVGLAIESDPGASRGASRKIDGAILLKYGTPNLSPEEADQVVIGQWSKRLKSYRELFGQVPSPLQLLESELEKLRRLRNDAGHKFGRAMSDEDHRSRIAPVAMTRISLATLKKYLGVVEKAARAIDSHLLDRHIGAYEMIYFYHSNRPQTVEVGTNVRKLRKALGNLLGVGPSVKYCQGLKTYYENL